MKKNLKLFITFFKIGLVTFGGGLAMMPLMIKETVEKNKWVSEDEVVDYYALAQTIPGIIAANVAVMIGHKANKFLGSLFALLGMVLPSIIVICIIAALLQQFSSIVWIQHALKGINIAVLVMLIGMIVKFKKNIFDIITILIAIAAFILIAFFNLSPIYIIVGAALLGVIFYSKKIDVIKK